MDGGAASVDRRIDVGDRLVSVKNFPGGEYVLDNCTHEEVGQLKLEMNNEQRNQNSVKTNTLETGYKNNSVIRGFFPRTKSCNLSGAHLWFYKIRSNVQT